MLFSWIERMRGKPPAERARAAFMVALVATSLVALVWFISIPARFSELSRGIQESSLEASLNDAVEGLPDMPTEEIGAAADGVRSLLGELSELEGAPEGGAPVMPPDTYGPGPTSTPPVMPPATGTTTERTTGEGTKETTHEKRPRSIIIATSSSEQ